MTKCRKVRYRDAIAAKLAVAKMTRNRASKREETRAYLCPDCRGWHLSSKR